MTFNNGIMSLGFFFYWILLQVKTMLHLKSLNALPY